MLPTHDTDSKGHDLRFEVVAILLFWCGLFYQLKTEWAANEQYGYGWFVPFLAGGLFWRRWLDRPASSRVRSGERAKRNAKCERSWFIVIGLLLFSLLPIRLTQEANVGWRSAEWLHGIILVILSLDRKSVV